MKASASDIAAFRAEILAWYAGHRRSFPWRETRDPWAILVSEVMLQQTQTARVLPKYVAFLEAFPDPAALAGATVAELLVLWSGLGYNRRALALKKAAEAIVERHGGSLPEDEAALLALPGVGPYTAGAVRAFAWGRPSAILETNIRAVLIDRFFTGSGKVADSLLLPLAEAVLDRDDPRNWYYALMDFGVDLKRRVPNPTRRSASYSRQGPFADSNRRIRGALLRALVDGPRGADQLAAGLPFSGERVDRALADLVAEGFVDYGGGAYALKGGGSGA